LAVPEMKKIEADGIKIQLAVWEGKGKNILCIHGLTANCRCWDGLAGVLAPQHRVLALDLRGRGLSDRPSSGYSVETHTRDVRALLDNLGFNRVVLIGHSLGAFITLAFAAQNPDRVSQIILVDGGGKLSPQQTGKVLAMIKPSLDRLGQVFPSFESYLEAMRKVPFFQPWSPVLEAYFRHEVEEVEEGIRPRIQARHIEEEIANLSRIDAAQFYSKVRCPVLILRATEGILVKDDILLPAGVAQRMVREMPGAEIFDVEGTNHYSILFQPNSGRDGAILEFLKKER